jgi:putative PIN family toxin of toxin-antitoxin system
VVLRPKFRRWFSESESRELLGRLQRHATCAEDPPPLPGATRDPADDYLVALARATRVDAIVSGDRDLIDAELGKPPVWTPVECVRRLRETRP